MRMTKGQLLKLLQEDNSSMDTLININLECTNNDKCIFGEIIDLTYDKRFGTLTINGTYEEDEF
jgi:hypothetical protein